MCVEFNSFQSTLIPISTSLLYSLSVQWKFHCGTYIICGSGNDDIGGAALHVAEVAGDRVVVGNLRVDHAGM